MRTPWVLEAVEVHHRPVLRGVSFAAPAQQVTAVTGGTVAQRRLLFAIAIGMASLDRGAMLVLGEDMPRLRPRARTRLQRRIGALFGGASQPVVAELSARDNVAHAARRAGRRTSGAAVDAILGDVGLSRVAEEPAAALSDLQRRRLALARAVAGEAPLILAEEIDRGDAAEAGRLAALVRRHAARGGGAVLFAADPVLATAVADVVVSLDEDWPSSAGPTEERR